MNLDYRKLIYVAGPYTHPDPVHNTHEAIKIGDMVWECGACPVIPHLSLTWHLVSPAPVEVWYERDLHLLARCEGLVRFPGASHGADKEVAFAEGKQLPVLHLNDARGSSLSRLEWQNQIAVWLKEAF